jgi:hypothetical protein
VCVSADSSERWASRASLLHCLVRLYHFVTVKRAHGDL